MKFLTASLVLVTLPWIAFAAPAAESRSVQLACYECVDYGEYEGEYATLVSYYPGSPINVRDGASTRAYARHIGYAGDRVEVLDRYAAEDGYMWFFVRFTVSNATGWVRGDYLALDGEGYWN